MKRTWIPVFIVIFILFVIIDFLGGDTRGKAGLLGFHMAGLFAVFGLIACVALITISKLIGHYWLQRKEDYYDRKNDDE